MKYPYCSESLEKRMIGFTEQQKELVREVYAQSPKEASKFVTKIKKRKEFNNGSNRSNDRNR